MPKITVGKMRTIDDGGADGSYLKAISADEAWLPHEDKHGELSLGTQDEPMQILGLRAWSWWMKDDGDHEQLTGLAMKHSWMWSDVVEEEVVKVEV
jgi:hypothetical protein